MTYNIRNGRGTDDRVDLGRIADVIASFDPDVVALQEVDDGRARSGAVDQADELGRQLGMAARFAPALVSGSDRYGIATLTRLPVLATEQVALPYRHGQRRSEPRLALVLRLAWAGIELDVVNTHLSVLGNERPAQVAELLGKLTGDIVVLAGDFNCTPWSATYRSLCCRLESATKRVRSWPARLPFVPIDHILYRGPLDVIHSGTWSVGPARRASDHLPVTAELELRSAA